MHTISLPPNLCRWDSEIPEILAKDAEMVSSPSTPHSLGTRRGYWWHNRAIYQPQHCLQQTPTQKLFRASPDMLLAFKPKYCSPPVHVTSFSHKLSLEMNLVKTTAPEELKVEILECPMGIAHSPGYPLTPLYSFWAIRGGHR